MTVKTVRSETSAEHELADIAGAKSVRALVDHATEVVQARILGHRRGHWLVLLIAGACLNMAGTFLWSMAGGNEEFGSSWRESQWISYMLFIDPGTQTGISVDDSFKVQIVAIGVSFLGFIWSLTFLGTVVEVIRETLMHYNELYRRLNMEGHLLVLGWGDKTFFLLNELLAAEQTAGFHGRETRRCFCCKRRRRLQIVLLAKRPEIEMKQEVRMYFHNTGKDMSCIHFWQGDPMDRIELMKVSASRAANILVMGSDRRGADQEVIRTLLSLAALPEGTPQGQVFGEMRHPENLSVVGTLMPTAEAIVARIEVNRVLVLRALVPSVGFCMKEMATFTEGTNELYVRPVPPALIGMNFFDAARMFTHSVVCGVQAASGDPRLMPEAKRVLQEGDQLLTVARCQHDADVWERPGGDSQELRTGASMSSEPVGDKPNQGQWKRSAAQHTTMASTVSTADILQEDGQLKLGPSVEGPKVVLMIGCPHDFPNLLDIVDCYLAKGSSVHVLSMRDIKWRNAALRAYVGDSGVSVQDGFGLERVEVHHYVGDSTRKGDLSRLPLAKASCAIILADRADGEEPIDADTRTLTTAIALKALLGDLKNKKGKCKIATEILDAETEKVISINSSVRKTGSFVYSSSLEAGLLAMAVAQKTSFNVVKQLLERRSAAGYVVAVPVSRHVTGREWLSFLDLRERIWRSCRGILLGWRRNQDRYPNLNPADKTGPLDWWEDGGDELIVMRRPDQRSLAQSAAANAGGQFHHSVHAGWKPPRSPSGLGAEALSAIRQSPIEETPSPEGSPYHGPVVTPLPEGSRYSAAEPPPLAPDMLPESSPMGEDLGELGQLSQMLSEGDMRRPSSEESQSRRSSMSMETDLPGTVQKSNSGILRGSSGRGLAS